MSVSTRTKTKCPGRRVPARTGDDLVRVDNEDCELGAASIASETRGRMNDTTEHLLLFYAPCFTHLVDSITQLEAYSFLHLGDTRGEA